MSFVHLHNHSHYSILEWLPKPSEYAKKAKELGMKAVALTDTSNVYGCHEFYKSCIEQWIKPILWTEILVESSLDEKINHKLVLLAKNINGYRNILSLVTKANLSNSWSTSRIKLEDIKESSSLLENQGICSPSDNPKKNLDIVALSWPISWEIPFYILSWKTDEEILDKIKLYQDIFWEDDFYLEILDHEDIPKQKLVTKEIIRISEKYKIPIVAAQNCYYLDKEDMKSQDVIMALGSWHELENPDRPTLINWDYSFTTYEDMQMLFWFIPEALENTNKIADKIDIKIETWNILIPKFELPNRDQIIYEKAINLEKNQNSIKKLDTSEWYLRYLSFKWLNYRFNFCLSEEIIFELVKKLDKKGLQKKLTDTLPDELKELSITYYTDEKKNFINSLDENKKNIIDRLEYELLVVHEMWFDAYFLIVADYINWAKYENIPVWPGRWSAAWSLMAYLSWITDLDPLKYDLLFERFLNPARISMPDIDTDFADNELHRVIEYCTEKYWKDKVVKVCTFGTFAARAAIKDVWRVYGISFSEMNELVKTIPEKVWIKLEQALKDSFEFAEAYKSKKYKEIIDNAIKIEWNVRQIWVHACALIIAPEKMTKYTALQYPPKDDNSIITQYSAYPLEDLGLLKMDFLWLRNLTVIKRTVEIIEKNKWKKIDVLNLDTWDSKALETFALGDTLGVFQFESDWMKKYLRDLKPNSFDDLIAMVSLYRPGPLAYIPTYIKRKHWEKVSYMPEELIKIMKKAWYSDEVIKEQKLMLEEDLKKILDVTYGIAVYQEQLIFMVQYMAWFSLGEADLLRRWVWKKKVEVIEALKKEFIEKWEKFRWYKPELTKYIYEEMIQPASNYSFNKSHWACYALISYQTAYLKSYYPTEFLTSLMVSDEENIDRVQLEVFECSLKWISVLAPNVNESLKHFTYIDDKTIVFWFKAIKWIWDTPINKIIETRDKIGWTFRNLEHFIESCPKEVINKKTLEALIRSWAIDKFWERASMLASVPNMINFSRKDEDKKETNQMWLFDDFEEFQERLELEETESMSFEQKLHWEREVIWFWVSGHPLDGMFRYCSRRSMNTNKLKMSFDDLSKLPEYSLENKKENEEIKREECEAIWVVIDFRKIFTKTWKPMIFLKCEWYDYSFELTLFSKDVEKYWDKIDFYKIIIVEGFLDINLEYSRKSIRPKIDWVKIASISQVRDQAIENGLFDENQKKISDSLGDDFLEDEEKLEDFESSLDEKINDNKSENLEKIILRDEYVIDIPSFAKKQDLVDLKNFLLEQKPWKMEVFINLNNQKISTNIKVLDSWNISLWVLEKFGG